jgi:acyl-CoA synthetase (AMP-forming)/AMP-acid ligase II
MHLPLRSIMSIDELQGDVMLKDSWSLAQKIEHARRIEADVPHAQFRDISEMLNRRRNDTGTYLIFQSSKGDRNELSYREFMDLVEQTAEFMIQRGLQAGDRIATVSHNHWHTVVHYFAAWMIGVVVVPVNLGEDDDRIRYILQAGQVKLAFVRDRYVDRMQKMVSEAGLDISLIACDESTNSFTSTIQNKFLSSEIESRSDQEALIVFTSGTTGNPKGVVLTQRNLLEDARAISEWHSIDSVTRMMCVLPIHHVNGTVVTLCTPFYAGGSVVLNEKFSVGHFFEMIAAEQVHIVSVVPTLLSFLTSHHAEHPVGEYPTLRHIICGAGPLTVTVAEQFETRFGIRIIHGYGLSETTCYSCYLPVELSDEDHRHWMREHGYPSIGVALDVNEMDIHDPEGRPVGDGNRGEIVIRGRNVMTGYYANDQANENAFTYGWFRSGDEGFTLRDGRGRRFYFITGRLKELIIRGGVNLAPLEIDEVINRAPGVKAGISVGFENDWYGEEVGAYVQMEAGVQGREDEIIAYCRYHLPFSKCPKVVVFGNDIPVTSTGKYQRMKVAHLFTQWKGTQFKDVSS